MCDTLVERSLIYCDFSSLSDRKRYYRRQCDICRGRWSMIGVFFTLLAHEERCIEPLGTVSLLFQYNSVPSLCLNPSCGSSKAILWALSSPRYQEKTDNRFSMIFLCAECLPDPCVSACVFLALTVVLVPEPLQFPNFPTILAFSKAHFLTAQKKNTDRVVSVLVYGTNPAIEKNKGQNMLHLPRNDSHSDLCLPTSNPELEKNMWAKMCYPYLGMPPILYATDGRRLCPSCPACGL